MLPTIDFHVKGAKGLTALDNGGHPSSGDFSEPADIDGQPRPSDGVTRDAGSDER